MRSVGVKLIVGLAASLAGVLLWLGAANLSVLRENLETSTVLAAQGIADVIFRSTRDSMLRNDRVEQVHIIRSIGAQPGVRKVRIFAKTGAIQVSSAPGEIGQMVDKQADACYGCHSSATPLEKPATQHTFRIYRRGGERVIGLMRPIHNEPACSSAACHAHPSSQRVLGVLDVVLSLERVDEALAAHERRMRTQLLFSAALLIALGSLLAWLLVSRPVRRLIAGVNRLASGNLAYRFGLRRRDEIGALAGAFDHMAGELEASNRTLEERIERKTRELEAAQEKLIHTERLASLGELAAAVAHEINNPLAGISTYARLLEKSPALSGPALEWARTIQRESRRCGQIAGNLLAFAREQRAEMAPAEVKTIAARTLAVVRHRFETQPVEVVCEIPELPALHCDASQIQQVLTAIVVNALDAMAGRDSDGSRLRIRAGPAPGGRLDIAITNNGPPIPSAVLPRIFEPFFSTKQEASGVGLGLAVAYGIVKQHGGEIQVETGPETTFHVLLPVAAAGVELNEEEHVHDPGEVLHSDR